MTYRNELVQIEAILPLSSFYRVFCDPHGIERSGAVIVSQMSEQVDFARQLYGRVANLVPVDDIEEALDHFTTATQTVGIYPDALRRRLRDECGLRGAQMLVPVGYATTISVAGPMDGTEAERRMCRWIADADYEGAAFPGPWMHDDVAPYESRAAHD